jgi:hypothetical protein
MAPTLAVARASLTSLLAGPTSSEKAAGLTTAIPAGTHLLAVSIKDRTATVDLSKPFARGGGSLSMTARLAQVVYTVTQFPTVSDVRFRLDGRPVTVFGGEGVMLAHPVGRSTFEALAPAILVETPTPGMTVFSPVHLSGTADVFEAVFQARVVGPKGQVLAQTQVHASSGSGTRGGFDVRVAYSGTATGRGLVMVFDLSPRDGSRQHLVRVPVVFTKSPLPHS